MSLCFLCKIQATVEDYFSSSKYFLVCLFIIWVPSSQWLVSVAVNGPVKVEQSADWSDTNQHFKHFLQLMRPSAEPSEWPQTQPIRDLFVQINSHGGITLKEWRLWALWMKRWLLICKAHWSWLLNVHVMHYCVSWQRLFVYLFMTIWPFLINVLFRHAVWSISLEGSWLSL